ncbi:hypothetical protein MUN88_20015 [Gracilibacillus caseinilyticus]|uniref:Uncharacterized protein n=1 Tax=Gracilibacillus caseinilyticus TaxID=2932256 RepID=A0ABY4EV55_9BACI|nr:hypothetical protein [Gracilibacillus caseinilyticus]UOQ48295.1 hypothetical protein MUN88_20015 [Gracilibacillus caseinilyticus]
MLNQFSNLLTETLTNASNYQKQFEKQQIVSTHLNNGKWIHRQFVENASRNKIESLYKLFNLELSKNFFDFNLMEDLLVSIQNNYSDFLRKNIMPEIADNYQRKFDLFVGNKRSFQ